MNVLTMTSCLTYLMAVTFSEGCIIVKANVYVESSFHKYYRKGPFDIKTTQFIFSRQDMELHVERIVINDITKTTGVGKKVNLTQAVNDWKYYLNNNTSTNVNISILITGKDLYDYERKKDVFGFALTEHVCHTPGFGIVEWTKSSANTNPLKLAHYIGHILGADHDGFLGPHPLNPSFCKATGHIMAPIESWSSLLRLLISNNDYKFSDCSLTQLKKHYAHRTCLNGRENADV